MDYVMRSNEFAENSAPEEQSAAQGSKKGRTPQERAVLAGKIAGRVCFYLFLALLCVLVLFPVVWMVANSMKTKEEIDGAMNTVWTFLPSAHPSNWFQAYGKMFCLLYTSPSPRDCS